MHRSRLLLVASVLALAACDTTSSTTGSSTGTGDSSPGASRGSISSSAVGSGTPGAAVSSRSLEELLRQEGVSDRVLFATDSSTLSAEGRNIIEGWARLLRQNPSLVATIEGHADERGTREYNLALGERRATSAKNFLVSLGIQPQRISTVSFGKERPAAVGSNEAAWAQNRRSVLVPNQ